MPGTPIRTDIATHYLVKQIIVTIVCVGLAVWGWYDLKVTIPTKQSNYDNYVRATEQLQAMQRHVDEGGFLRPSEREEMQQLESTLSGLDPTPPSKYDEAVQWMFVSCALYLPYGLWVIYRLRTRRYELDEEGNLTIPDGTVWKHEEIVGIDMDRWMAKSVAFVQLADNRSWKLDAYLYRNMEQIIGRIAHRFAPDQWHLDGKKVVASDEEAADEPIDESLSDVPAEEVPAEDEAPAARE